MSSESQSSVDAIWVKPHFNSKGGWVRGHWRTPPRVVHVRGHFRGLSYVRPFKRRRPAFPMEVPVILAGQPPSYEHTLINILRDVEPLMGY
ncbi:MAG: hypothetical protein HW388_1748 [Dehalococcoidia bacterium]|nr:hypothetical protein [Dehalococcoidia bacterium]